MQADNSGTDQLDERITALAAWNPGSSGDTLPPGFVSCSCLARLVTGGVLGFSPPHAGVAGAVDPPVGEGAQPVIRILVLLALLRLIAEAIGKRFPSRVIFSTPARFAGVASKRPYKQRVL